MQEFCEDVNFVLQANQREVVKEIKSLQPLLFLVTRVQKERILLVAKRTALLRKLGITFLPRVNLRKVAVEQVHTKVYQARAVVLQYQQATEPL